MVDMADNSAPLVTEEEFKKYAETMKARTDIVDKLSKDEKLKLYSLGKQGMEGDNTAPKPGMLAIKEKYKWKSWEKIKGMDQQIARNQFTQYAKQLLKEWEWYLFAQYYAVAS